MSVKISVRPDWSTRLMHGLERGLFQKVLTIDSRSAALAPKLTGALVNSRRVKKTGEMEYTLSYGDARVPYARKRFYENKKHPGTKYYLAKAAEAESRGDQAKYFRGKV